MLTLEVNGYNIHTYSEINEERLMKLEINEYNNLVITQDDEQVIVYDWIVKELAKKLRIAVKEDTLSCSFRVSYTYDVTKTDDEINIIDLEDLDEVDLSMKEVKQLIAFIKANYK